LGHKLALIVESLTEGKFSTRVLFPRGLRVSQPFCYSRISACRSNGTVHKNDIDGNNGLGPIEDTVRGDTLPQESGPKKLALHRAQSIRKVFPRGFFQQTPLTDYEYACPSAEPTHVSALDVAGKLGNEFGAVAKRISARGSRLKLRFGRRILLFPVEPLRGFLRGSTSMGEDPRETKHRQFQR
jgi:hypothetical protein